MPPSVADRPPAASATLAAAGLLLLTAGCLLHRAAETPEPPFALPGEWSGGSTLPGEGATSPTDHGGRSELGGAAWCPGLTDPALDALIDAALTDNLSLQAAWARVEQADALAVQAGSGRWPTLDATLGATRSRTGGGPMGPTVGDTFQASLAAGYEVDLWGRLRDGFDATLLDAEAARNDARALAVTLTAQLAESWYDLVLVREKRDRLTEQLATQDRTLAALSVRFENGLATGLDLLQQEQQRAGIEAQLLPLDALAIVTSNRLDVLTGATPNGSAELPDATLPSLDATPETGVPADLLLARPDVRAALERAEAADHRVTVALASRLPTLRLTGTLLLSASDPLALLDELFWSIGASLTEPLVDGGRRRAELERTEAVVDERIAVLGQTLLTAMEEVETALARETSQRAILDDLDAQLRLAQETLVVAREQYRLGAIDYLRVLTAEAAVQRLELSILEASRQLVSWRIQLCRATGGDWTSTLSDPTGEGE